MTNSDNISTGSTSIDSSENTSIETALNLDNRLEIDRHSQSGFDPEKLVPKPTYVEVGVEKLTSLCDAVGLNAKTSQITEVFRAITTSWGDKKVGDISGWMSDVSDDGAPFEFSIALDPNKAELRVLIEAQGSEPTLQSNWQAGLELNQQLAKQFNVSLDRFEQIADLFSPTNSAAKFSMWHAVCFYPDKEPAFKLYLNPQSQSPSRAAAVVEESMVRLGFTHAWPTLAETAAQRGPDKDEFIYFSLDLAAHSHARVKVYLRHHDATPTELESALSAARNYVPGDAIEFCQAMAEEQSSFSAKSMTTCFSWVEGDNANPSSSTLQLPISNYALNDRVVCDRLDLYLIQHGLPFSIYHSAIQAFATRLLDEGVGMHSYISLRRDLQNKRLVVYLNPEVNVIRHPKTTVKTKPLQVLPSLEEIVLHYENHSLSDHPFLQRLSREPVNPKYIWLLVMNLRETSSNFTRRLANVVARIDDERIRCILAKQLNDELGNGDINGIHRKLFEQLMTVIDSWKMESFKDEMLMPGKEISMCWEEIFLDSDSYVGVGATMVLEVYGKQFDLWLGQELRKTTVDLSTIKWVTIHEELEIAHADESIFLAHFVSESEAGVAAARQGIEKACLTAWNFMNALYRLSFCES
jgi:DMATS type aromatic prenyltransferase